MLLARDHIGLISFDFGCREGGFRIATSNIGGPLLALVGLLPSGLNGLSMIDIRHTIDRCIGDVQDLCRGNRLLKRFGYDEGDGLPLVIHLVVLQHVQSLADVWVHSTLVLAIGKLRRIAVCEDGYDAGQVFRCSSVDIANPAACDRAAHDGSVGLTGNVKLSGVGCRARDLLAAIDPAEGLPDHWDSHFCAPATSIARTMA